jgi:hypothetical protein
MNQNKSMSFSNSKGLELPVEKFDKKGGFMKWGVKNDYPFYIIELYNGSAWHQGIVRTKTHYIASGGVEVVNGQLNEFIENKHSDFTINEVVKKMAFDFELFDGFGAIGTWNKDGTRVVRWEHIDTDKIRSNGDESLYFISDNWASKKQSKEETNYREIKPLDKKNPVGKFLIFYKSPSKQGRGELGVYPKPNYYGGMTAINTDMLISKWHLHGLQNGFKSGTIVNFADGEPDTDEKKRAIRDDIKGQSTSIEDTNNVVITFSDGKENAPEVIQLNGNDLADRYNLTEKSVQQNILVAHGATNPLLFGIKTEGQLGGATELMESYEIFKSVYVQGRQKTLEWALNLMAELSGFIGEVKLKDVPPVEVKEEVVEPEQMTEQFRSADKDLQVFKKYGAKKENFKIIRSISVSNEFGSADVANMEQQNFNMFFDKIGDIKAGLTELDKSVLAMLKKGEDGTSISKAIDKPLADVAKSVSKLTNLNLLVDNSTSALGEKVLEGLDIEIEQFEVRYSYEVKSGLGAEVIPTTRDFCKELIRQDRMYLRSELDTISGAIGRDVWRYRGGFYHNKKIGRTTPWCRHEWKQHLTIKK